jgi:uncharacterized protein YyaL (SSP411 family)
MQRYPSAAGQMLIALDWRLGPTHEIAILGDAQDHGTTAAIRGVWQHYIPNKLVAHRGGVATAGSADASRGARSHALDSLFAGKQAIKGAPTAYVCENFACQAPVVGVDAILKEWERLAGQPPGEAEG